MAPRSFSEDGAAGARSDGDPAAPQPVTMNDPGPAAQQQAAPAPAPEPYQASSQSMQAAPAPAAQPSQQPYTAPSFGTGMFSTPFAGQYQNTGGFSRMSFADGGAIEDTDGSPQQDAIQKALSTVDGVLAFGRKLHGLGGDDDGGAIKTAGLTRMPGQPPSQSESGVPPQQPMPGRLPPTSNPFGKRTADAGATNDSDDSSGAIDTDEETA